MGDINKAGSDRGDISAELRNLLISARIRREEYLHLIDELDADELRHDLLEYRTILERQVIPLLERAQAIGVKSLIDTAQEIKAIYDEIIDRIQERIGNGEG
ncbi:MAG: hypothetical protein Q9N26_03870 [Aquificota bacterium]|nr:hypothetical protein [Aquificota bacterium]